MSWLLKRVGLAPADDTAPSLHSREPVPEELPEMPVPEKAPSYNQDLLEKRNRVISPVDNVSVLLHHDDNTLVSCNPETQNKVQIEHINQRFTSFKKGLAAYIQRIALSQCFTISRSSHKMDTTRAQVLFDLDNVVQRGFFYCTLSGLGIGKCGFKVPFMFDFVSREYVIKSKGLVLVHNHSTAPLIVDGITYKGKRSELTLEENTTILEVYPFVGIGALRRILRNTWPNVDYDSDLL